MREPTVSTVRRRPISREAAEEALARDRVRFAGRKTQGASPLAVFVSSDAPQTTSKALGVPLDRIDGYPFYRIPAIIRAKYGRLLAFAEGRFSENSDSGKIDIVFKTSDDEGHSWSNSRTLVSDRAFDKFARASDNTCGNPTPVFDVVSGRVWLLWTWNRGDVDERKITSSSRNPETSRLPYAIYSDDNGETWHGKNNETFGEHSGRKGAIDLSLTCKDPSWAWFATGPAAGICTSSGELLVAADMFTERDKLASYGAVLLHYNRLLNKWIKTGVPTPAGFGTNESAIVELTDGRIMLNARHQLPQPRCRVVHITGDLGETWEQNFYDEKLPDPQCEGSILSIPSGPPDYTARLLFSNLRSTNTSGSERKGLSVQMSYDDGRTWVGALRLYDNTKPIRFDLFRTPVRPAMIEERSGYSSLVNLGRDTFGILYEGNAVYPNGFSTGQFGVILFAKLSIAEVLASVSQRKAP